MRRVQRATFTAAAVVILVVASGFSGGTTAAGQVQQRTDFAGEPLFKTYCATCHGASGTGDGPFAAALRKRPPDLTQLKKLNQGTFPTERVTQTIDGRNAAKPHGPSDMPVWGDAFSRTTYDNDPESVRLKVEALVKFIEKIQERPMMD